MNNSRLGRKIETIEELEELATERRAVVVPSSCNYNRPKPAAVLLNMSAGQVLRYIRWGMYLYIKRGR